MPAVAQINVNFANRNEFATQIPRAGVSTVKSISPYTLVQYMLYNRENSNFQPPEPSDWEYLTYRGGFITAGDKVNVKHDSDLQLRRNLDVERSVFVEKIFSRRYGDADNGSTVGTNYQLLRGEVPRSVTISSNPNNELTHFIRLNLPTLTDRTIELKANTTSIRLENNNTTNAIGLSCLNFNLINTGGLADITGRLNVVDDVSFQKNVKIVGSATANTETFEIRKTDVAGDIMFKVDSANGNVNFKGDLDIDSKFTVDSATGDTVISRDLNVKRDTLIEDNLTVKNSTSFEDTLQFTTTENAQSQKRRIRNIRRVDTTNSLQDIYSSSSVYLNDPLAIGDFRTFFLQAPKQINNASYTAIDNDNQKTILMNNGSSNVSIILPAGLTVGLQISFIRLGTGLVTFVPSGGAATRSAPTDSFTKLAFTNSAATFYLGYNNTYYLFGDLLP